jgi:hypothetical protein
MARVQRMLWKVRRRIAAPRAVRVARQQARVATRKIRILPSFLIVGVQRAGTTSLFDYLLRHPDVSGPLAGGAEVSWSRKELHFFDERFWRGIDWYRSFFPTEIRRRVARLRGGDLVAGEATPYYMFHPRVPDRVAATIPDMRIIVLLREPVERAYSHYTMMVRAGRETLTFEEALAAEEKRLAGERERVLADPGFRARHHRDHSYFSRGLYAEQLERWFAHFPREQVLILDADDFFAQPAEVYSEVLAFLGLRPRELGTLQKRATTASPGRPWSKRSTRNRAAYDPIDPVLETQLAERYAEHNARLYTLLGKDFEWPRGSLQAGGQSQGPGTRAGAQAAGADRPLP